MSKALVKPIMTFIPNQRHFTGMSPRGDTWYIGSKSGVTVDAFRSKIRDGVNAGSAYQMDALRINEASPFALSHSYLLIQSLNQNGGPGVVVPVQARFDGFYLSPYDNGFSHRASSSASNEAESLSRLYSKVKAEYESFNSLNFLGELGETVRMLRSPAKALLDNTSRFLDTLKSTRQEVRRRVHPRKSDSPASLRSRRLNAVKDGVAGSWLEYAFGLVPLMSDVKDIAETAARALVGAEEHLRVRAKSSNTVGAAEIHAGIPFPIGDTINMCRCVRNDSTTASVQYVAGLASHRTGPARGLDDLARLSGFSIENFIPTAYQLAPWSFLVDYFLNLGDVLEAAFTDTSSVIYFARTERVVTTINITEAIYPDRQSVAPGNYISLGTSGQPYSKRVLTRTTLTRSVGSSLPMPPLVTSIPGVDSTKWFNIAALISQAKAFRF